MSDAARRNARKQMGAALEDVIRLEAEERVRRAYIAGFGAGERHGMETTARRVDRIVYRRGYQAGYKAARNGSAARPDGSQNGAPRLEVV
jgi:hypothetical protein